MNVGELFDALGEFPRDAEIEIDMRDPQTGGDFDAKILNVRRLKGGGVVLESEMIG